MIFKRAEVPREFNTAAAELLTRTGNLQLSRGERMRMRRQMGMKDYACSFQGPATCRSPCNNAAPAQMGWPSLPQHLCPCLQAPRFIISEALRQGRAREREEKKRRR